MAHFLSYLHASIHNFFGKLFKMNQEEEADSKKIIQKKYQAVTMFAECRCSGQIKREVVMFHFFIRPNKNADILGSFGNK